MLDEQVVYFLVTLRLSEYINFLCVFAVERVHTRGFKMLKRAVLLGAGLLLVAGGILQAESPTFQELMDPEILPYPQRGMRVESVRHHAKGVEIVTTGAKLIWDTTRAGGLFRQRIGHQREVVRIEMEILSGKTGEGRMEIVHDGPGLAFVRSQSPRFDLRANGDSLFMFHVHQPVRVKVERRIQPGFDASWKTNHLLLDERGGFGLYCSRTDIDDLYSPYEEVVATYELPKDAVLWVAVCPPKPYDWRRSLSDQVIWHWSNRNAYPPDEVLKTWADQGNIVLLQSEVMLWKNWNLGFEPRHGGTEFIRVRDTLHRLGMRMMVYTSPHYFLRGTGKEGNAINSFENFTGWPHGTNKGENIDLFLQEIGKLLDTYQPDGLYFDGQYIENPAGLYLLARKTRQLLGSKRILEWHSTYALGMEQCYLPQADAYVDFILRGEGRQSLYDDPQYLRYFVSGYNAHNSIGVICNNSARPDVDFIRRLLAVNGRMHTLAGWLNDPKLMKTVRAEYLDKLTPSLRQTVKQNINERQSKVAEVFKRRAAEYQMLTASPNWDQPIVNEKFKTPAEWEARVSSKNEDACAAGDQGLSINAHANTYAFLNRALDQKVSGFALKLKQGCACVRWPDGTWLRVGLRSDGAIQADIAGDQRLAGKFEPDSWVWLRARWGRTTGVIEYCKADGSWKRLWRFEHGGKMVALAKDFSVGKVPFNGKAADFTQPGPRGTCYFTELCIY